MWTDSPPDDLPPQPIYGNRQILLLLNEDGEQQQHEVTTSSTCPATPTREKNFRNDIRVGGEALFRNLALKEYLCKVLLKSESPSDHDSYWLRTIIQGCRPGGVVVELHVSPVLAVEKEASPDFSSKQKSVLRQDPLRTLSGPSQDSKLLLMGMPREVRDEIFRLVVLSKHDIPVRSWRQCTGDAVLQVSTQRCAMQETWEYGTTIINDHRNDDCKHAVNIFRTCKQAYEEARTIFYGENRWLHAQPKDAWSQIFQDLSEDVPPSAMAADNAALIKCVTFDLRSLLPASGRPTKSLAHSFVSFVCHWLPGLQSLRLTVEIARLPRPCGGNDSFGCVSAGKRVLLYAAACITRGHSMLRKAIWEASSGPRQVPARQQGCILYGPTVDYGFYIQIVPTREDKEIFERHEERLDEQGEVFMSTDLILDCHKIRDMPWDELGTQRMVEFSLPQTATSSEPVQPMVID